MNSKQKKPRAHVPFNTGTRVHKTGKGKGSYDRKGKEALDASASIHMAAMAEEMGYECVDIKVPSDEDHPFGSYTDWMEWKKENHTDPDWHLCRPRTKTGMQERHRRDKEIASTLIAIEEEVIRSAEKIAAMMGRIRKNL
tara:strand:- start:966 stop:1385 length:420 start_codon:yes stop_codon:yes gene_type:complete